MGSTGPWWGGPVIALASAMFGVLVTASLPLLGERKQRRRLARDKKVEIYLAVSAAATDLALTPVWPKQPTEPAATLDGLRELCRTAAFFGTEEVNKEIAAVLRNGRRHVDLIALIHRTSKPGHGDIIDRQFNERYHDSAAQLTASINSLIQAGRHDTEVTGSYWPIEDGDADAPQRH
jgi:hypothetical protein